MIEKLNEMITIQQNSVVVDEYGNHKNTWTDYFTCHARAYTYSKYEKEDVTMTDERSITFEVRYCSELYRISSVKNRVVFHGEIYDIESIDMMNWDREKIHIACRKEERS